MRKLIVLGLPLAALSAAIALHDAHAACDDQTPVARAACLLRFPDAGPADLEQSKRAVQALVSDESDESKCLRAIAFFNLHQIDRTRRTLDDCADFDHPEVKALSDYARTYLPRTISSQATWPVLEIVYDDESLDLHVRARSEELVIPVVRDANTPRARLTIEAGTYELTGPAPLPRIELSMSDGLRTVEIERDDSVSRPHVLFDERDMPLTDPVKVPIGVHVVKVLLPTGASVSEQDAGTSEADAGGGGLPIRGFVRGDQVLLAEPARAVAAGVSIGLAQSRLLAFEAHPAYVYANRFMGADVGAGLFFRLTETLELGPVVDFLLLARYDGAALGSDRTLVGVRPTVGLRWLVADPLSVVASGGADFFAGGDVYRSSSGVGSLALELRFGSMP